MEGCISAVQVRSLVGDKVTLRYSIFYLQCSVQRLYEQECTAHSRYTCRTYGNWTVWAGVEWVSEWTWCERIKRSVLFAFVAVNTLQIGDEDGEFVGKSVASNGSVWFSFESRGKVEAVEEIVWILHRRKGNYTSRVEEVAIASLGRPRSTRHLRRFGRPGTD